MRQKRPPPARLRCGLGDRRKNVGTEDWKQLPDASQEHLHVLAVRFRKPRSASLILFESEPVDLRCFGEKSAFKIPHVSIGQVLVLAYKDDGRNPELPQLIPLFIDASQRIFLFGSG